MTNSGILPANVMHPVAARLRGMGVALTGIGIVMVTAAGAGAQVPPYSPSPVVEKIAFDWSTHRRGAQGSDNFQLAWSDDGHQYGWWGTGDNRFGETRPGSDLDWKFNVFFAAFSPKWLSDDGRDFTLTFTGGGRGKDNDSFNTLRGRFVLRKAE